MTHSLRPQLLDAAVAFDDGDFALAEKHLCQPTLARYSRKERRVYLALWRRYFAQADGAQHKVSSLLDELESLLGRPERLGDARELIDDLVRKAGIARASVIAATAFWREVLAGTDDVFGYFCGVVAEGWDGENVRRVWLDYLGRRSTYVPDHRTISAIVHACYLRKPGDVREAVTGELAGIGRADLCGLAGIQVDLLLRRNVAGTLAEARELTDPLHRHLVADQLLDMALFKPDAGPVEAAFGELVSGDRLEVRKRTLMTARLQTVHGDWDGVLETAGQLFQPQALGFQSGILRANARVRTGQHAEARRELANIAGKAPGLRSLCDGINAVNGVVAAGHEAPDKAALPVMDVVAGRPFVQSLWIGDRLGWLEQLSISSYLANGWRYQLYVYDVPENVPEGCEILDAAAIMPVPRDSLAGARGLHREKIVRGLSHLFRLELLVLRGGLWTETDVINLKRFEPDGRSFVSATVVVGGMVVPGSALLAAPAGSPEIREALRRARARVSDEPQALADIGIDVLSGVLAELGRPGFMILPPEFAEPLAAAEVSAVLGPRQAVEDRQAVEAATCFHLHAGMLGAERAEADALPDDETFLGHVRARFAVADQRLQVLAS